MKLWWTLLGRAPFIVLFLIFQYVDASHFRGGIFMWKPTHNGNEVAITFRMAWRRTYNSDTYCDRSTIDDGNLIANMGSITCFSCSPGTYWSNDINIGTTSFVCTDYSVQEDWTQGEKTFTYNFGRKVVEFGFTGNAWIYLVYGGGSWEMRTRVDLNVRADTGLINSSPTSAMPAIVRLQYGCNHTITIPVYDEDNDIIKCRWANSRLNECGGVCSSFRNSWLYETCKIQYSAVYDTGWYAAAIQIEDFASENSTTALSSVPLQFLVHVFQSTKQCQNKPTFVVPTRQAGACVGVPVNSVWSEKIIARGSENGSISEINTVSPTGVKKSDTAPYDRSIGEWYVNITWSPKRNQMGDHPFCYTASDSDGLVSERICITLLVGVFPPEIISYAPRTDVYPSLDFLTIQYDREFVRPTRKTYIYVYKDDDTLVTKIDVSQDFSVKYPANGRSDGWKLGIPINFPLQERKHYYVKMDPGVAKGITGCGAESSAIWNPETLKFRVRDITPPVMTPCSCNPSVTSGNITIKYTFNEPVTVTCTLQQLDTFSVVQCTNSSWTGQDLSDGVYTLLIQGTDTENNTAYPVSIPWSIDRTGPILQITHTPRSLTNEHTVIFHLRCNEQCKVLCRLTPLNTQYPFQVCSGSLYYYHTLSMNRLFDRTNYTFEAKGVDRFGNEGNITAFQLSTDFTIPTFGGLHDFSINCSQEIRLQNTVQPTAMDESGIQSLTYRDKMLPGCKIQRTWTAVDKAGNSNSKDQIITLISPFRPTISFPPNAVVACGSLDQITNDVFIPSINYSHPCDIKMSIGYKDPISASTGCGFSFLRIWTASDTCGIKIKSTQEIQIQKAQDPITPNRGDFTDLQPRLIWTQNMQSTKYQVFVWSSTESRPTSANYTGFRNWYRCNNLQPASKYYWQVEFLLTDNTTEYSPRWYFLTNAYPDLSVISVTGPPIAHSGQSFDVQWIVQNIAAGQVSSTWYDELFIGFSTDSANSRSVGRFYQNQILLRNDTYEGIAKVSLLDKEIGSAYLFIRVDRYNYLPDLDRANNFRRSQQPISCLLTPPPDLVVTDVSLPSSTFSGQRITVQFTISNIGRGVTKANRWTDSIYWSSDEILDIADLHLVSTSHQGILSPGDAYSTRTHISIPRDIFGVYHIIVKADIYSQVFEYLSTDNNDLTSNNLTVVLTPPPDLSVSDLSIHPTINVSTGDTIQIKWTVENVGQRAPYVYSWYDQLALETKGLKRILENFPIFKSISPNENYTYSTTFTIDPSIESGWHNLSIHTDAETNVFEFHTRSNNIMTSSIYITQSFPDLEIHKMGVDVITDKLGYNTLNVSWSVRNVGKGQTANEFWTDSIFLVEENIRFFDRLLLSKTIRIGQLQPNSIYHETSLIRLDERIHGRRNISIKVDSFRVLSGDNIDNNLAIHEVNIQLRSPNIKIVSLKVLNDTVYSGHHIRISWTVVNLGLPIPDEYSWRDTLKINDDTETPLLNLPQVTKFIRGPLPRLGSYTQIATVLIPQNFLGYLSAQVVLNSNGDLFEGHSNNDNSMIIPLKVLSPPTPDLVVKKINSYLLQNSRTAMIAWTVYNEGNSMNTNMQWLDAVGMQTPEKNQKIILSKFKQSFRLESGSQYTINQTVLIPSNINGQFNVYVSVDSNDDIQEVNGESNNWKEDKITYTFSEVSKAKLTAIILSTETCSYENQDNICVVYNVSNDGEQTTEKTSWDDALFISVQNTNSTSNMQNLNNIALITHIGALAPGSKYTVNTTVDMPLDIHGNQTFLIYPDYDPNSFPSKNRTSVIQAATSHTNHVFYVPARKPCENLYVVFASEFQALMGGQPVSIMYNISNNGTCDVHRRFFVAIYLTKNVHYDMFERKIKTVNVDQSIFANETLAVKTMVDLPFTLETQDYSLVLQVDSRSQIIETDENDNIAISYLTIQKNIRTDILVSNISVPTDVEFGTDVTISWSIYNNGSQTASGYKCDNIYFSEDGQWDINDHQFGKTQCDTFELESKITPRGELSTYTAHLPPLASKSYRTIVKVRTNVEDYDQNNNIAVSSNSTNVRFPHCTLGGRITFAIIIDETEVIRIPNVPADRSLLVRTTSQRDLSFHEIFVKFGSAPSEYDFDSTVINPFLSNQNLSITNTREGDYYILVKAVGSRDMHLHGSTNITLEAKLAKFEIMDTNPKFITALGNVTLHIFGTLLPEDFTALLYNESFQIQSQKGYWFSSSLIAATFDVRSLQMNSSYSLNITNHVSQEIANAPNVLKVVNGIAGEVVVRMSMPGPLLVGETGEIKIDFENIGQTDALCQIIKIQAENDGELMFLDNMNVNDWSRSITFIVGSLDGPGGILSPSETGQLLIKVKSNSRRLQISMAKIGESDTAQHSYLNMKMALKPKYYNENDWNMIWENFIQMLGKSWLSLQRKVSEVVTEMSLVERQKSSLNGIMHQILQIADGVGEKSYIVQSSDFENFDTTSTSFLNIIRIYPRRIGLRGIVGTFGMGWLSPYWECYIEGMDEVAVFLYWKRGEYIFSAYAFGIYTNEELGNITMISADLVSLMDKETGDLYKFNITTGNISSIMTQNVNIEFMYDDRRVLKNLQYAGNMVDFVYNDNNNIVAMNWQESPGKFKTCMYSYTESNFLSVVNCGGKETSYQYNERGHLTRLRENTGSDQVIRYAEDGRLKSIETHVNEQIVSRKTYIDYLNGRIQTLTMPQNDTESYWINMKSNVVGYKRNGFPLKKIHRQKSSEEIAEGDLVIERQNWFQHFHELQDSNGDRVFFQEDENGNLVSYADGNFNIYHIIRSFEGSIYMINYPDDSNETFVHSNDSITHTDQGGRKIAYHFDKNRRLKFREYGDNGFCYFRYSATGQILSVENQYTLLSLSYDENGLVKELRSQGTTIRQNFYNHNLLENVIVSGEPYNIAYTYNIYGQITSVMHKMNNKILLRISYDSTGMISSKTLGNNAKTAFTYHERTRLPKTVSNFYPNGTISSIFQYAYDKRGRVSEIITNQGSWSFSYDLNGQLAFIRKPSTSRTSIVHDRSKNRVSVTTDGKTDLYQGNSMNQYVSINADLIEYDTNGNLIKKGNVSFGYDEDNRLIRFATPSSNCTLQYNGIGHIKRKLCTDNVETYYTDSLGRILKQENSRRGSFQYNIYAPEIGLVATIINREYHYYQYDALGSVVEILNEQGRSINNFQYDAFGNVIYDQHGYTTQFLYMGQWSKISFNEIPGIQLFGHRLYDSKLGRFLNMDRQGIFCKKSNLYIYKDNNPLQIRTDSNHNTGCHASDPDLQMISKYTRDDKLLTTSIKYSYRQNGNGIIDSQIIRNTHHRQKRSPKSFLKDRFMQINKGNGLKDVVDMTFGIEDRLKDQSFCEKYIEDKAISKGLTWLENKIFKASPIGRALDIGTFLYKHRSCIFSPCDCLHKTEQSLHNSYNEAKSKINSFITDDKAREHAMENACNEWTQTCVVNYIPINCQASSQALSEQFNRFKSGLQSVSNTVTPFLDSMEAGAEGALEFASDACQGFKDLGKGFIRFVNSHDPNDLVGPVGFGAARFVSKDTEMVYKIQFENDANASAPAQRVFIEMKLDSKFNSRTFRLGKFGFGSYQKEINFRQSVIQEKIDMTEDLGLFVALRGGLDIINNKASWEFQAINASTGLPPSDPSVGFLPPNNGTTGQGFVTFSIKPSSDVKSLDKITAKAAIIFDQNEPIDTPEVFNTIDNTAPYIRNLTVDEDLLKSGSLVLNLDVEDDESGLDYVNIMMQSESGYTPLLNDVREKAVVLRVKPGQNHTFAILPVDRIGNIQNLHLAGSEYFYTVYTPVPEVRCDEVNNCSGNGQCLEINYCLCTDGFYGTDCSKTSPPLDPPILDVFFGTQNNITVPMHLLSSTTSNKKDAHIIIKCTGFPEHSYFSAGSVIGDTLYLAAGDFGDILFIPPENYVNNFTLDITTLVFIESTSEFIERKTSRFIEIKDPVSREERRQYLRTYLRTTTAPPTSTLKLLTKITTSSITHIQTFANRNPSTTSPKYVSLSSHASTTTTSASSTKPTSTGSTTMPSTTMAPTKKAIEKTSGLSPLKQSVIAGIASSLGILFTITILVVLIRGCRNSKRKDLRQIRARRGAETNHGIEDDEDETGM